MYSQNENEEQASETSATVTAPPAGETTPGNNNLARSRWHHSAAILSSNSVQIARQIPRFVFDPDSSLVFYWMVAVAVSTLYNAWMIALRIAFPEVRQEPVPIFLSSLDYLCDIIYLLDIAVQLRTAYLLDGIPVFSPSAIRAHYTSQSYFIQDMVSVMPMETIVYWIPEYFGDLRYVLCVRGAARLTRLAKFHSLYRFYDMAESCTSNPHCIRLLRLSLSLAIIIHWIACLYYLASEYEGLGSNAWVYTNDPAQQRFLRKYIICFYWSAMTLTTIGTDSNPPETDLEYVFTGGIFLTGVFVFATVLGNVGDVISSMNANRQEFQAKMDHIKMYLTHKKVPPSLQLKIKKWAEYSWSRTKATDESRLLNMLPERLRAEVAMHVHLESLRKVKIFEQCEIGFLCELVLKLRSQVFSPGDFICKAGETGREMFIINHGKVEVLVTSPATNKEMVVAVLCVGNYFGEISLLRLDGVQNRRTADVRSVGYSELLCLSRRDLMAALVEYPEAKTVLESQAKKRIKINKEAQRAFSVDTMTRNSQEYSSLDSVSPYKEDMRGGDVREIKAMIEELKIANQMPGKKIWQLIAKCDLLQSKLDEKEKEVHEARMRVVELETLLSMRHNTKSQNSTYDAAPFLLPDRSTRITSRFTKQFSQEEGRYDHISASQLLESPEENNSVFSSEKGNSSNTVISKFKKDINFRQDTLIPFSGLTVTSDCEETDWSSRRWCKRQENFEDGVPVSEDEEEQYLFPKKLMSNWIHPPIIIEEEENGKSSESLTFSCSEHCHGSPKIQEISNLDERVLSLQVPEECSVRKFPISFMSRSCEDLPNRSHFDDEGSTNERQRLNSVVSCLSDESSSRRNSAFWDSDNGEQNSDTD